MKKHFPPQNQSYKYLQTNRSDDLGSIWSSFNLDFQQNLSTMRLANKLATNTTSSDDADLGLPAAFEFFYNKWFAICGTKIFKQSAGNGDLVTGFIEDVSAYGVGSATTRFDITNPAGTTYRYTFDGTGTNPGITALTFPIGASVGIYNTEFANANKDFVKTITGSGANYFEITNVDGMVEVDQLIGTGFIVIYGGTIGTTYNPNYSDLTIFNDNIWATTPTELYRKEYDFSVADFGAWFKVDTLTSSIHKLLYFEKRNRLYYFNSSQYIRSVDSNYSVATTGDYTIDLTKAIGPTRTMVANSDSIWIGTIRFNEVEEGSRNSVDGAIYQWDGLSAQVTKGYKLKTSGVLSMCVVDDIPYAIDTLGRVLQYTGYSFKEIARLPLNGKVLLNSNYNNATNGYPIHYNGMTLTENNTILINVNNINGDASGLINENLPSGIWELDLETGNFTHKYSPTLKALSSSTVTDFGQNRILSAGAIRYSTYESDSTSGKSNLIAGFGYYTNSASSKYGIFIDSPIDANTDNEGQKRGYVVTTWFQSDEVESTWTKVWNVYKRFKNSTDKIIFKYRLEEEDPVEATIAWTSTSTFTTTTNVAAYVGYEAEIIQGTGSGACTNITSITEAAGTYTVTIDTAITGVTGTAKARFQKWKKIYPEANGIVKSYTEMPFDATNVKIQIKMIMEWTGDGEFSKFILMDDEDIISNL